ncbi:hypothetical protein GGR56DRAFT_672840 [Xylariaceae sp. FL0804]|nr:hypothetical protein GGR56DRAFT_672840 [Xylariaceae sp. FL0804]
MEESIPDEFGLTSFWIHQQEQRSAEIDKDPLAQQLSRYVNDLSAAGSNLFHAIVELQRVRASSERKFQRWFFEVRAIEERSKEINGELNKPLDAERASRDTAVRAELSPPMSSSAISWLVHGEWVEDDGEDLDDAEEDEEDVDGDEEMDDFLDDSEAITQARLDFEGGNQPNWAKSGDRKDLSDMTSKITRIHTGDDPGAEFFDGIGPTAPMPHSFDFPDLGGPLPDLSQDGKPLQGLSGAAGGRVEWILPDSFRGKASKGENWQRHIEKEVLKSIEKRFEVALPAPKDRTHDTAGLADDALCADQEDDDGESEGFPAVRAMGLYGKTRSENPDKYREYRRRHKRMRALLGALGWFGIPPGYCCWPVFLGLQENRSLFSNITRIGIDLKDHGAALMNGVGIDRAETVMVDYAAGP